MNKIAITNMVNLILNRNQINTLPVPIETIGSKYAEIIKKDIPFDFDGLTFRDNGKDKIFLNNNVTSTRMRFTLAHEIGHVIIPWHTGIIADSDPNSCTEYNEFEIEANQFATELLLPSFIIEPLIESFLKNSNSILNLCKKISSEAQVSLLATTFRVFSFIEDESFFVVTDENNIIYYTNRSNNSLSVLPALYDYFDISLYSEDYDFESFSYSGSIFYYLRKKESHHNMDPSNIDWRETLTKILTTTDFSIDEQQQYRQIISGIFGAFNSMYGKKIDDYNEFRDNLKLKFDGRPELTWLKQHELFNELLDRKATSIFINNQSK